MGLFSELYESFKPVESFYTVTDATGEKTHLKLGFTPILTNGKLEGVAFKYGSVGNVMRKRDKFFFNENVFNRLLTKTDFKKNSEYEFKIIDVRNEDIIECLAKTESDAFVFTGKHVFERINLRITNDFTDEELSRLKEPKYSKLFPDQVYMSKMTGLTKDHNNLHSKEIKLNKDELLSLLLKAIDAASKQNNLQHNEIHAVGKRIIDGVEVLYPVVFKRMNRLFNKDSNLFYPQDLYLNTILPVASKGLEDKTGVPFRDLTKNFQTRSYFKFLNENVDTVQYIDLGEF